MKLLHCTNNFQKMLLDLEFVTPHGRIQLQNCPLGNFPHKFVSSCRTLRLTQRLHLNARYRTNKSQLMVPSFGSYFLCFECALLNFLFGHLHWKRPPSCCNLINDITFVDNSTLSRKNCRYILICCSDKNRSLVDVLEKENNGKIFKEN